VSCSCGVHQMDSSADSLQLQPGHIIAGKYQVERILGAGGMGVVVAALHIDLERRVAIKLMLPEVASHADSAARFMREGKAACRLKSEHVAKVLDVGRLDSGVPYMVMELLEGSDLSDMVQNRGALPVQEAVDYVIQACEAVAEAHTMGIVHRDLKPANLFVARDAHGLPCVKVLDFGISKVRSADGSVDRGAAGAITSTQTVMGSPLYMSPEQMKSARHVDGRADIWGLGAILYELLTAQALWNCESLAEVCAAVLTTPAPRARDLVPTIPEGLEAAILMCLEKDANQRMPSAKALVQVIAPYASPLGRATAERVLGAASVPPPGMESMLNGRPSVVAGSNTGPGLAMSTGPGLSPGASTNAAWGQTGPGIPPARSNVGMVAGIFAGVVAVAAVAVFVTVRLLAPSAPAVASSVPATDQSAVAPALPSSDPAPAVSSAAAVASAAPTTEPEKTEPAPARTGTAKVKQPVTAKPPATAKTAAPATTRTDYGGRE